MSRTDAGPTITVLMPVYNGARFLEEQVLSILDQRGVKLRLVAIDDGSDDRSAEILRTLADQHRAIDVQVHAENSGLISTVGELLTAVETPYFAMADQDDIWDRDKLSRSLAHLLEGAYDLVYSDVRLIDAAGCVTCNSYLGWAGIRPVEGREISPFIFRNPMVGHTVVGTRAVAEAARDLPRSLFFYEPYLAAAAAQLGGIGYVPDQLGSYRVHGGNVVGPAVAPLRRILDPLDTIRRLPARQAVRSNALSAIASLSPEYAEAARIAGARGFPRMSEVVTYARFLRNTLGDRAGRRAVVVELGALAGARLVALARSARPALRQGSEGSGET